MRRIYGLTLLVLCSCFEPRDLGYDSVLGDSEDTAFDAGESVCGNRIVDPGEDCDDGAASRVCDDDCTEVQCGDGILNVVAGEVCEQEEFFGTTTCEQLGYLGGELHCGPDCRMYDESHCFGKDTPVLTLTPKPTKQFIFSWEPGAGASFYRIEERPAPGEPFVHVGESILESPVSVDVALFRQSNASYRLQACIDTACVASEPVPVMGSLADAVGYVKASNPGSSDYFGYAVAMSRDGNTVVVGAYYEDGNSDTLPDSGAVYVYRKSDTEWEQDAYLKASNPSSNDEFGRSVAVSADGNTVAVGAYGAVYVYQKSDIGWVQTADLNASSTGAYFGESVAMSADGNTMAVGASYSLEDSSGAVHVYRREDTGWEEDAYLKASNAGSGDRFGWSVAMSADGNTVAVGAYQEDGEDDEQSNSGAVYVYRRDDDDDTGWAENAYLKASSAGQSDYFGYSVAMSADGNTVAVGAYQEDDEVTDSGAVYVYRRDDDDTKWAEDAYLKASNPGSSDYFGYSVAMSADGNTVAMGAPDEDGAAIGVNGDQDSGTLIVDSGAVYVYRKSDTGWVETAYLKAPNPGEDDYFGYSVAMSADGNTVAVGAYQEDSAASGVNGDRENDDAPGAGAVYVY